MTDSPKADLEALEDLVQSRGFALYSQMVRAEIHDQFQEQVLKQLAMPDKYIAIERARQVLAVQQAGERWLKLPKLKIDQLRQTLQQKERELQTQMLPGRRPAGL